MDIPSTSHLEPCTNSGDTLDDFKTGLSELPRSMLFGPGGVPNPSTRELFDEHGIIKWNLLTRELLWRGLPQQPKRESEGFLQGSRYLFQYSEVLCDYWKEMNEPRFVQLYGNYFGMFTADHSLPLSLYRELHLALHMDGVEQQVRAMKVARIITSCFEKMLYVCCHITKPERIAPTQITATTLDTGRGTQNLANSRSPKVARDSEKPKEERLIAWASLKMKDILALPILQEMLGPDKQYLLKMLIGPLHGVNLRNLLWHGFIAPHEWPTYHTCLLFGLLFSVAREFESLVDNRTYGAMLRQVQTGLNSFDPFLLQTSAILRDSPPETERRLASSRPLSNITLRTTPEPRENKPGDGTANVLRIARAQRHKMVDLISKSPFCLNGFRSEWVHAVDMVLQERHFEAMNVIFPLLEASLRRVYVDTNNIQSFRMTAEPDTLCLSLDLILEDWLDREVIIQERRTSRRAKASINTHHNDNGTCIGSTSMSAAERYASGHAQEGQSLQDLEDDEDDELVPMENDGKMPNQIFEDLGQNHCMFVFDLLMWGDTLGLSRHYRARDQLAHGSAVPSLISRINSIHLLLGCLSLMQHYMEHDMKMTHYKVSSSNLACVKNPSILDLSRAFIDDYQPCFHKKRATIDSYWRLHEYMETWMAKCNQLITPAVETLLERSIEKAKKPEDHAWTEKMKRRKIELEALQTRLTSVIDASLASRSHDTSADMLRLFPIRTPISFRALTQLYHTFDMIEACRSFMEDLYKRFEEMTASIAARTAWLQDRRNYHTLLEALPVFALAIDILLLLTKEILSHADFAVTVNFRRSESGTMDFPTFILNLVQRTSSQCALGKFKVAEEVFDALFTAEPKTTELLGKGEGFRCWLDIEGFVWRVTQFSKGIDIEDEYHVWEHPRNAHIKEKRSVLYGRRAEDNPRTRHEVNSASVELFLLQHSLGTLIV